MATLKNYKRFIAFPILLIVSSGFALATTQLNKPQSRQTFAAIDNMPILHPDPAIDYKIQIIPPDPTIDFGMPFLNGNRQEFPTIPDLYSEQEMNRLDAQVMAKYRELFAGEAAEQAIERHKELLKSKDVQTEAQKKYDELMKEFKKK
jgi:hypothetical protein